MDHWIIYRREPHPDIRDYKEVHGVFIGESEQAYALCAKLIEDEGRERQEQHIRETQRLHPRYFPCYTERLTMG